MISVYICDDEAVWLKRLKKAVTDYQMKSDWEIKVERCEQSPEALLEYLSAHKPQMGIYLLDIDLKSSMNGLQLAEKIRSIDMFAFIVIVTTHEEMSSETFRMRLGTLDYITKDKQDVEKEINDCLSHIEKLFSAQKTTPVSLTIRVNGSKITIPQSDIYYIETILGSHKIRIHQAFACYELRGSLSELQAQLQKNFVPCSKSCLVNRDHICAVKPNSKLLIFDNEEEYLCSVRHWRNFSSIPSYRDI